MRTAGRWMDELEPDLSAGRAGGKVARVRLADVASLLRRAASRGSPGDIHRLRVATRRASTALRAFQACLNPDLTKRARRRLRAIRRAAAQARAGDVHAQAFRQLLGHAGEDLRPAVTTILRRIDRERAAGAKLVRQCAEDHTPAKVARLARELGESAKECRDSSVTVQDVGRSAMAACLQGVHDAAARNLSDQACLHALRVSLKRLRYTSELFARVLHPDFVEVDYPRMAEIQESLGRVSDVQDLESRLGQVMADCGDETDEVRQGVARLADRYAAIRARRHSEALRAWDVFRSSGVLERLAEISPRAGLPVATANGHAANSFLGALRAAGEGHRDGIGENVQVGPLPGQQRLAAIDVGSNSIRLIIAEAEPDGSYRVLDDEREVARLAQGLDATGELAHEAMVRAAETISRMRAIARGYGVRAIRLVGTAAVREAANQDQLRDLVMRTAELELHVISAVEEGKLAYLSASHAFDLESMPACVADIGGASAEVVACAGGVIDRIYTLKLGAVRLTDRFGGPEACSGDRFKEMRDYVDAVMREEMRSLPFSPRFLVGTGGTFSVMAAMESAREAAAAGQARPRAIQGFELRHSTVRHVLDQVRKTPVRARGRIPGLAADRADIIVAGMTIADALMRRLGVNIARVHERGVRDGLLLTMIREIFPAQDTPKGSRRDPLAAVRRFARQCRYEEAHAEHVTRLALSIFDQIAPRMPDGVLAPDARLLLEAAGILHDIGYLINYAKHHKHSYNLILNSDLEGLSPRQVEMIANIARYHRRARPKKSHENFKRLAPDDRRQVELLAGILRIADGLDRTHTQSVRGLRVRVEPDRAVFVVQAEGGVETDVWGAQRKNSLFRRALGLDPVFEHQAREESGADSRPPRLPELRVVPCPSASDPTEADAST